MLSFASLPVEILLIQFFKVHEKNNLLHVQFSSLSRVRLFATLWTAAHQAFLSITKAQSLLKLMSIKLVMPSNHLILCHPLLLPPPIFPSIRVISNESVLCIRWPKYWSSALVLPTNTQDWFPLGWVGWISLKSRGLSRVFSNTTVQKHQFFGALLSLWSNSHIHTWLWVKPLLWLDRHMLAKECLCFSICYLGWS